MKKLRFNIPKLQKIIPAKPAKYTSDIPYSITESLEKYLRSSTVGTIRVSSWILDAHGWPLPLYVDPKNIKIGLLHKIVLGKSNGLYGDFKYYTMFGKLIINTFEESKISKNLLYRLFVLFHPIKNIKYYDWLIVPIFCKSFKITNISDIVIDLFDVNFSYFQSRVRSNKHLESKQLNLSDIFSTYQSKNYASCISTIYPLLDFLTRLFLNVTNLRIGISNINKVIAEAGFTLDEIDNLKPGAFTEKFFNKHGFGNKHEMDYDNLSKKHEYGLGFPGIALSSFLHFSSKYYAYYTDEGTQSNQLNRHAILHGANTDSFTKENTVKLLTYMYLMLELEPVLKIVFEKTEL